ncbi:protein translocase subunit SECA2, chloroplastic-like [Hevea brasiliensis]|uniref:protein translocase subunit SECA2, chloroplastic-like n=1 Tax=Hevea brasiliensis TaxID=3981 RepID=UPI0025F774D4|nr:protein translocase subunit SECA2, chloroplastic-like [Hevea brasiliensis]
MFFEMYPSLVALSFECELPNKYVGKSKGKSRLFRCKINDFRVRGNEPPMNLKESRNLLMRSLKSRGRAGRQGDPGSTRFMVSLQDEMFQKFNFDTEWAVKLISRITNDEDIPIEGDAIVKQLLALQINAEKYFFGIRKSLVEFDEVLEVQRKHVYDLRQLILTGDNESCSQHISQ